MAVVMVCGVCVASSLGSLPPSYSAYARCRQRARCDGQQRRRHRRKKARQIASWWAQGGLKRLFGSSAAEGIWVPLLAAAKQEVEALGHERKPMPRACGLTRHRAATLLRPHAPCAASFPKPSSTSPSVALQSLLTLLARLLIVTAARPQSKRLRTR